MNKGSSNKEEVVWVKILPCHCDNPFQDTKFGKGRRVHNLAIKTGDYRCTVCGYIRSKVGPAGPSPDDLQKQRAKRGAKKSGLKASGKQGRKKGKGNRS